MLVYTQHFFAWLDEVLVAAGSDKAGQFMAPILAETRFRAMALTQKTPAIGADQDLLDDDDGGQGNPATLLGGPGD